MEIVTKMFIRARESVIRNTRGQTMTEYALIIASVGIISWAAYQTMGSKIGSMTSGIDSSLTNV
jgi:Flp pilus assembly pilin Flp